MDFEKVRQLHAEISQLTFIERSFLMTSLLEDGVIDFAETSKVYVSALEKEKKAKNRSINTLSMMLGVYAMTDKGDIGKAARKHLYDTGMYGHNDGSGFGKILDDEFGNNNQ